jgi:hypothetical protein
MPPIPFAPMDCPSHRLFIPIQQSKIKIQKIKFHRLPTPYHMFSIKKRDERQREKK